MNMDSLSDIVMVVLDYQVNRKRQKQQIDVTLWIYKKESGIN